MPQRDNILQELAGLNSSLVDLTGENVYSVPAGYFDGLAETMLNRIKALHAANAVDELNYLAPSLNALSKQNPYTIPAGYFDGLAEKAIQSIRQGNDYLQKESFGQTAKEEIESLSPLLSGLKKQMPYSVPQGYFDNIETPVKTETKIVSITGRKWLRYAVAAVFIGLIAMTAVLIFGNKTPEKALAKFEKRLNKEIKKMSDQDLNDFIQYTDAGLTGEERVSTNNTKEVKELLKDIPESELKEFLEETADVDDAELTLMD